MLTPIPPDRPVRGERGSALMLMPAAVLIVLTLAAITVDTAIVHLGRRELVHAADAAANDAVTYGFDEQRFRRGEGYLLDERRAREAVVSSLAARGLLDRLSAPPVVRFTAVDEVRVELHMEVDYLFARALPGVRSATVEAHATAVARQR
ncbi:MAG: pilus assembly protein TadG-related protein [Acidimicrobiales bacterium]